VRNTDGAPVEQVSKRPTLKQLLKGNALTGLLAWWDAERSVWSDTGLTTRANNGDAVAGWSDQGSSGYHVTQSVSGDRPIYRQSVPAFGGKPGVQFVSSDVLTRESLSSAVVANLTTYSIYVIFATTAAVLATMYSEGRTASSVPFVSVNHSSAVVAFDCRDDASVRALGSGGSLANNGAVKLVTLRRAAATDWSLRLNGTQVATDADNVATTTINRLAIGAFARNTITQFFTGHIAQVLLYNTDNYLTVEPILRSYYNV
jgi:hypothetical protein